MKSPARFLVSAVCLEVVLFGLLRAPWVSATLLVPFTRLQADVVQWYGGGHPLAVSVTLSCSGADVLALACGAILAYPAPWRRRLTGSAGALACIVPLNLVRIGTLSMVGTRAPWFSLLHLYVWPAVLVAVTALYFFVWIQRPWAAADSPRRMWMPSGALRRFAVASGGLLVVFGLAAPWIMSSAAVATAGGWIARAAAAVLGGLGLQASATGNALSTSRGAFLVTPACIATPLIPVYLAGVLTAPMPRPARGLGLLAAIPLFVALGVLRLLALALPPVVATSPVFVAHAFYQLLAFVVLVAGAAYWQAAGTRIRIDPFRAIVRRAVPAGLIALAFSVAAGSVYVEALLASARAIHAHLPWMLTTLVAPGDGQGALHVLPVYQASLWLALAWIALPRGRWTRLPAGLLVLFVSQLVVLAALGGMHAAFALDVPVLLIRAWAVALPPLLVLLLVPLPGSGRPGHGGRRAHAGGAATVSVPGPEAERVGYRRFWHEVGDTFPDLGGAASTRYYFDNEVRLLEQYLPDLNGLRLLKTDLWDEAKNTRILQWAASRGARPIGIDISRPILDQARGQFDGEPPDAVQADVRALPFADGSMDAIYSMGTIEHFDESAEAARELWRVLRPGGRAIIGVPNRHDPFLRPLFVSLLSAVGWYGYGYERSFSRRALRTLIEGARFRVIDETAILFIPGWLRMLDLACHCWCRPLSRLTAAAIQPFVWVDRHLPRVRRHGYLLATVVERPIDPAPADEGTEQVVDAFGCDPGALRSRDRLAQLFAAVIEDLGLHPVQSPIWHVFPRTGGLTGLVMLAESHLACHTYPERGTATFNLYCCRTRPVWPWQARLGEQLGASRVTVRTLRRGDRAPSD